MTCPACLDRATQRAAGPSQAQCKLPRSQRGSGTRSREKGNSSTLVACLSPPHSLGTAGRAGSALPGKGHCSRALRSGQQPPGVRRVCLSGCGDKRWLAGRCHHTRLPPSPATAGWAQGSRTRRVCAGTQPLPQPPQGPAGEGRCPHLPRGWRHCTLCSSCCSWHPSPKNVLAKTGNTGNHGFTYSEERCAQFVREPTVLMGHSPLATFICPTTFCPWEMTLNRVSQRLQLLLWPSTPCIKYLCSSKTCRYCCGYHMVCW